MTKRDTVVQALTRIGKIFDGLDDSERLDLAEQTSEHLTALLAEIDAGRLDVDAPLAARLDGVAWALHVLTAARRSPENGG